MKTTIKIILGFLIFTSCGFESNLKKENNNETKEIKVSIDSSLTINGITEEDFKIVKSFDTITYFKQLYEGIDGKIIEFDKESFQSINAKIKFDFSFLQYTIDDNPAYPISYSKQSQWTQLKCIDGKIEIPDLYGNSQNIRVHEQLGYSSFEELNNSFNNDFEALKKESIREQTEFYRNLLQNKSNYEKCCPEYISQAENFFKEKESELNSMEYLGLELILKSVIVEVQGQLIDGKKFKRVIIKK